MNIKVARISKQRSNGCGCSSKVIVSTQSQRVIKTTPSKEKSLWDKKYLKLSMKIFRLISNLTRIIPELHNLPSYLFQKLIYILDFAQIWGSFFYDIFQDISGIF